MCLDVLKFFQTQQKNYFYELEEAADGYTNVIVGKWRDFFVFESSLNLVWIKIELMRGVLSSDGRGRV